MTRVKKAPPKRENRKNLNEFLLLFVVGLMQMFSFHVDSIFKMRTAIKVILIMQYKIEHSPHNNKIVNS